MNENKIWELSLIKDIVKSDFKPKTLLGLDTYVYNDRIGTGSYEIVYTDISMFDKKHIKGTIEEIIQREKELSTLKGVLEQELLIKELDINNEVKK